MKTLQTPTIGAFPLEKAYYYKRHFGILIITGTIITGAIGKSNLHKSIMNLFCN